MYRRHLVGSRESILLSQNFARELLFTELKWGQDVPMTASWKLAIRFSHKLIKILQTNILIMTFATSSKIYPIFYCISVGLFSLTAMIDSMIIHISKRRIITPITTRSQFFEIMKFFTL